ncbi:GNAT family N-acetyltransferase [Microbulbifer donghaiensis]|nr:GNAT family N-acetyltransferase [Microbulbifer donghaiensis]
MLRAYSIYRHRLHGRRLPPMDADYREEIASFPTWVAEIDDEIVGGITLVAERGYLTLANIAVSPEHQNIGLGKGLLAFAEAEAKRRGFSQMRLATHRLLSENVAFYQHLGWTECGRDADRIYMQKAIPVSDHTSQQDGDTSIDKSAS